jgi:hypothetical protein
MSVSMIIQSEYIFIHGEGASQGDMSVRTCNGLYQHPLELDH